MRFTTTTILFVLVLNTAVHTFGQALMFELEGMAGPGLTAANEPGDVIDGGSGDIGPDGVFLDIDSKVLSVDVEWGSANGYVDLSSDINFMNIHGPTSEHSPGNFSDSAETFSGLDGFNASAVGGGYVGETSFDGNLKELLEGRFYIHLHTFDNGGGEARGYFIPEVVIGDINRDGIINLLDVLPFVEAISAGSFDDAADLNRDNIVNLLDIAPFVDLLAD